MSEKLPFTPNNSEPTNEVEETPAEFQPLGEEALREFSGEELNKYGEDLDVAIAEKKKRLEELKSASGESTGNSDLVSPEEAAETANEAPQNKGIKAFFAKKSNIVAAAIAAGLLTMSLLAAGISMAKSNQGDNVDPLPTPATTTAPGDSTPASADAALQDLGLEIQNEQAENLKNVGELPNGLNYDYRERDDVDNKESEDAFGYNYENLWGDEQGLLGAYRSQATRNPEILAAYAGGHLTATEKAQLGISGDHNAISHFLENDARGGEVQAAILEIMNRDDSTVEFGEEANTWLTTPSHDKDNNGSQPDEVTYGQEKSPVVKVAYVYRTMPDGSKVLVNTLYLAHGLEIPPGTGSGSGGGGGETTPTPTPETPTPTPTPETPAPKNQKEADENSGAASGIVTPENQDREITEEPQADEKYQYNQGANTYDSTPEAAAAAIGYKVTEGPETTERAPGEAGTPSDFDASATVATGEVTGDTESADGGGLTIEEILSSATGVEGADYGGTGF